MWREQSEGRENVLEEDPSTGRRGLGAGGCGKHWGVTGGRALNPRKGGDGNLVHTGPSTPYESGTKRHQPEECTIVTREV